MSSGASPPNANVATTQELEALFREMAALKAALAGARRVRLLLLLMTLALLVAIAGALQFRRARTTVNPMKPDTASSLVTGGIYRFTRNPMYLGDALILLAWAVFLSNPITLAGVPLFVAWMNVLQIAPEERALKARFGEAFDLYCSRVRRWI